MRKAKIYFNNVLAGYLFDLDNHFEFVYDKDYLKNGFPISITLPLQEESFISNVLFPFFDGLIVEGWLLDTVEHNWKIDRNDRMSLLLLAGKDTIGAVSVIEDINDGL